MAKEKSDNEHIQADIGRFFMGGCVGALVAAAWIAYACWTRGGAFAVLGFVAIVVAAPLGFGVGGFLFWLVPEIVSGLGLLTLWPVAVMLRELLPNRARIGSFVASPNPVTAGDNLTLTASEITAPKRSFAVTGVDFYFRRPIGEMKKEGGESVTRTIWVEQQLGDGTRASPGVWSLQLTPSLEPGLKPGTHILLARTRNRVVDFGPATEIELIVQPKV